MSELTGADDGTVPQRPPPSSPRRERRTDGPRGSLRPASEERNETRVGGEKKRVGSGKTRERHGNPRPAPTGPTRGNRASRRRGSGPHGRPEGAPDIHPPHTTAASGTAAAAGGGSWSLRESRPNDRLPYGPHRPPTLGAAGRPPPGSLNLRAGTRQLGTRDRSGEDTRGQKSVASGRANPHATLTSPHTRQPPQPT